MAPKKSSKPSTVKCPLCKGQAELLITELADGKIIERLRPHNNPHGKPCRNRQRF